MLVLGIESTCDETGFAVVRDGREILSNVVATQEDLHARYGGVIPEVACRRHVDVLLSLLKKSLCVPIEEIDLIAVANGPGLIGALLIGVNFAEGLAFSTGKPLVGVNHIEAHLYSALMESEPELPALGVVMSGGHTSLVYVEGVGRYRLIGQTQDDAIGEAFDKAARLLGLPYPGGAHLARLAQEGNPKRYNFPRPLLHQDLQFSFSGLKTAVARVIQPNFSRQDKADVAASFEAAVIETLSTKALRALHRTQLKSLVIAGGVSANQKLREQLDKLSKEQGFSVYFPRTEFCTDNGAMIAYAGCQRLLASERTEFQVRARWPLTELSPPS